MPLFPLAVATHQPHRRRARSIGTVAALVLSVLVLGACNVVPPLAQAPPTPTIRPRDRPTPTPLPRIADTGEVVAPRTEVYLTGVSMPVGLAFAPDGRLFFSEAFNGVVRVAERVDGQARLLPQAFAQLTTAKGAEAGMLGVALHPEFEQNHWVYLYYTDADPNRQDRVPLRNRIVRFTERDNVGTDMTVILDDLEVSRRGVHNGGILKFGPDGKLYATVGNAEEKANSQDTKKLNGKILRLNPDGSVPSDNPIPGSPIYAIGFRNPFGLTFEPTTGQAWATENSGDHDDEINALEAGANYGFPHVEGPGNDAKYKDPVWSSGSRTDGITGLTFYGGDQLPQYQGDLFFCAMNTGALTRLRLSADRTRAEAAEELSKTCFLDVTNGPDGALYYSSVNQIFRLGR
jgi:glucose/arabinose dehydrogenase